MNVHELSRDEMRELKERYLIKLADEGRYAEVLGVDWDAPSWGEIAQADEIVPDDVIFREYEDIYFVPEDFFCSANLEDYDPEPAGWDLRHGEYEGDQEMLWN